MRQSSRWSGQGRGAEAVVGSEAHHATRREVVHRRECLLPLVADRPRAAVDVEEDRCTVDGPTGGPEHVEPVRGEAVAGVVDVPDTLHAGGPDRESPHEAEDASAFVTDPPGPLGIRQLSASARRAAV